MVVDKPAALTTPEDLGSNDTILPFHLGFRISQYESISFGFTSSVL